MTPNSPRFFTKIFWLGLLGGLVAPTALFAWDTVVIDAGHGGMDAGSFWYEIREKDLTLDLARRLEKLLNERGIKTVLTRKDDTRMELIDRARIANRYPNAIFISLHFNATPNSSVSGVETYYMSPDGARLADLVQREMTRRLNTRNRGIKKGNLAVLRETKCTAILIEGGFLSNRWENQRCASRWYRQILAEEIVEGLLRYR